MGENECDDGNMKSGDGCSSACKVEANYECTGGNETNADNCVNKKPPEFVLLKYYGNRTGVLTFSAPVRFLLGPAYSPYERLEDLVSVRPARRGRLVACGLELREHKEEVHAEGDILLRLQLFVERRRGRV